MEPPKCFLGCGNVRDWTLVISILNSFFYAVLILVIVTNIHHIIASTQISAVNICFWVAILFIILTVNIELLITNVKLRTAVLKRNIAFIKIWLLTQLMVFVISTCLILVGIYFANESSDKPMKIILIILLGVIFEGLVVLSGYSIYQFYGFLKTSSAHDDLIPAGINSSPVVQFTSNYVQLNF